MQPRALITTLHHGHIGELMIGLLLLQDLFAIIVLMLLGAAAGTADPESVGLEIILPFLGLPLLGADAWLLTNAIIYFNSLVLSNLLAYYQGTGEQENLELVKKVSPVTWLNVNLNGTYSFTFEQNVINAVERLSPLTGESVKTKK